MIRPVEGWRWWRAHRMEEGLGTLGIHRKW